MVLLWHITLHPWQQNSNTVIILLPNDNYIICHKLTAMYLNVSQAKRTDQHYMTVYMFTHNNDTCAESFIKFVVC